MIDARNLGIATAQSFVVDLATLLHSKGSSVELNSLGLLTPRGKDVAFEPTQDLKTDSDPKSRNLQLLKFLTTGSDEFFAKEELLEGSFWGGETVQTIFRQPRSKPFPGQSLIAGMSALLVSSRLVRDPD